MATQTFVEGLSDTIGKSLADFVDSTKKAFGDDLRSIILYGSGAEGKLRATSDVNLIVVLSAFDRSKSDLLREPFRTAHAAINLKVMLLLESEIKSAIEAFSVKFFDIIHRYRILYGADVFTNITIPREATIARLKQVLLNLSLRLREQYMLSSLREEQLAIIIADSTGPLRACAATILELKEKIQKAPKEALQHLVHGFSDTKNWDEVLMHLSEARETRALPQGVAGPTLFKLIELANRMRSQIEQLS
ncbi:MAG: hypothetical protein A2351_05910 [Omnitrophica bacterium RIFOXYB12_FULL_50_7]|nr:MAG: hypothetical protein A2351_05910 [Omnitrophica bacterium RIFOXYB12_FULL_50_7]